MWNDPTLPSSRFPVGAPPPYAAPPYAAPPAPNVAIPSAAKAPRRWPVVLLFMTLAGLIPETIVTSSTSVFRIVHDPKSLLFAALFYGTADIIIREAIIRRRLGLAAKILLGVAFGFVNEGVVAGTWYTVRPTGYTYVLGIDFGWIVSLTVFHIFISVLVPIYLIDSVVPSVAGVSLLKKRGIIVCGVLFVTFASLIVFNPQFRVQREVAFVVALGLAAIALRLAPAPPAPVATSGTSAPGVWRLRLLGFVAMLLYFICIYGLPALFAAIIQRVRLISVAPAESRLISVAPAGLANAILVGLAAWALALGEIWSRRRGWSSRRQLALMTGLFTFSLVFSFVPNLIAVWEPFITVPFMFFLIVLSWRAWRADRRAAKMGSVATEALPARTPRTPALR